MIKLPIELTNKILKLVMHIDIITINMCKFMTTITSELYYRTIHYFKTTKMNDIVKGLHDAMKIQKNTVFQLKEIHCDNEFNKSIVTLQEMYNYTFMINNCNPQKHILCTEQSNRTIKDRCHAQYYNLPYNCMTRLMIIYCPMLR